MVSYKVQAGTPKGENLCNTCRWMITREDSYGKRWARCNLFQAYLSHPTYECSGYDDKRIPALYDYESTAWRFIPSLGKFKMYSQITEEELKEIGER